LGAILGTIVNEDIMGLDALMASDGGETAGRVDAELKVLKITSRDLGPDGGSGFIAP
jgi:hypothetical protein